MDEKLKSAILDILIDKTKVYKRDYSTVSYITFPWSHERDADRVSVLKFHIRKDRKTFLINYFSEYVTKTFGCTSDEVDILWGEYVDYLKSYLKISHKF